MSNHLIEIVAKYFILLSIATVPAAFLTIKPSRRQVEYCLVLVLGGVISLGLALIAGHFVGDPRPFVVGHFTPLIPHSADNGFPSDHALFASLVGWVTLMYSRRFGVFALIIALLIGAARVMAGVHHVQDILGSFVITAVGVLLAQQVIKLVTRKRTAPPQPSS